MTQRLLRTSVLGMLTFALLLGGGSVRADFAHTDPSASIVDLSESGPSQASQQFELRSTIAFTSNRHNPTGAGLPGSNPREKLFNSPEIYLMDGDGPNGPMDNVGANQRRLTNNLYGDTFPVSSPDGKRIAFNSNRFGGEDLPTTKCGICSTVDNWDLFVMNADGSDQQRLTRGGSPTWSPDGKYLAYHASKSGMEGQFKGSPSAATFDSDIFVLNVDDCLKVKELTGVNDCRKVPGEHLKNITNSVDIVDDDADWSPDGTKIVYTRHPVDENVPDGVLAPHAEIYVMTVNPNGTPVQGSLENPNPRPLTDTTDREERAPSWSADSTRIAFARRGVESVRLELWVMKADGTNLVRLTDNDVLDASSSWSPDGPHIVWHQGTTDAGELWLISLKADGTPIPSTPEHPNPRQLTITDGTNIHPSWGKLRVHVQAPTVTQPARAPAAAPVPKR